MHPEMTRSFGKLTSKGGTYPVFAFSINESSEECRVHFIFSGVVHCAEAKLQNYNFAFAEFVKWLVILTNGISLQSELELLSFFDCNDTEAFVV